MKRWIKLTPTVLRLCVRPHLKSLENGLQYEDISDWHKPWTYYERLSVKDRRKVDRVKDILLQVIHKRRGDN